MKNEQGFEDLDEIIFFDFDDDIPVQDLDNDLNEIKPKKKKKPGLSSEDEELILSIVIAVLFISIMVGSMTAYMFYYFSL